MSANYSGFRFWSELYQGEHPYARCENGRKWVKARQFTWADYVTDAWDEAINCSEMVPHLAESVKQHLQRMGLSCPVDTARCLAIAHLDKAEYYVSPVCRNPALVPAHAAAASTRHRPGERAKMKLSRRACRAAIALLALMIAAPGTRLTAEEPGTPFA